MPPTACARSGLLLALALLLSASSPLGAERLALRRLTTGDGLAGDTVNALALDRAGGLWIGTSTGLSRFDGNGIRSFAVSDGLDPRVAALATLADGTIAVGGSGWLRRIDPVRSMPEALESIALPNGTGEIAVLLPARGGGLWIGAEAGLLRLEPGAASAEALPLATAEPFAPVTALAEAADGTLWLGGRGGLAARGPDGSLRRWGVRPLHGDDTVHGLVLDAAGRLWVAHGLASLVFLPEPGAPRASRLGERPGATVGEPGAALPDLPGDVLRLAPDRGALGLDSRHAPLAARDGRVWLSSANRGLVAFDAARLALELDGGEGTPGPDTTALLEDPDGGLWFGSASAGLVRWDPDGPVILDARAGLPEPTRVSAVVEASTGEILLVAPRRLGERGVNGVFLEASPGQFLDVSPPALADQELPGWGWSQTMTEDADGSWWLPTGEGALRFAPVARLADLARAPLLERFGRDQPLGQEVFRIYRDRTDDLWFSLVEPRLLARRRRADGSDEVLRPDGAPNSGAATAFAEDAQGHLWLGFYEGGLARWDGTGFERFGPERGAPDAIVYEILPGGDGALWVASSDGLFQVEQPGGSSPTITRRSGPGERAVGGASSIAWSGDGALLVGTRRGLERYDPVTGELERFGLEDGLPESRVLLVRRDRRGRVWIVHRNSLALWRLERRLRPESPPVRILELRVDGVPRPLPILGAASLGEGDPIPVRRTVEITFGAGRLSGTRDLRFVTRVGAPDAPWSQPSTTRTVQLAGLAPGRHRFAVRLALGPRDDASAPVASIELLVPTPWWRRPGALVALLVALALAALAAQRLRLRRLLALERVRTRIATDLHDDLGASLSRISVLAEVGRMQLGAEPARAGELLGEIGETARELSEATGDIVWSIDPRHDDLASLLARLRRFASDLLEGQGIRLDLELPAESERWPLAPETRRELYLILKEAIHNVARHAGARRARLEVTLRDGHLVARVEDDGRGVDPARVAARRAEGGGHGLDSMSARAERIGGRFILAPGSAGGTRVEVELPLRP